MATWQQRRDGVFVETPHDDNLDWHDWIFWDSTHLKRDALGRRNGGWYGGWLQLTCNNSGCPARALVRIRKMIDWAADQLPPLPEPEERTLL